MTFIIILFKFMEYKKSTTLPYFEIVIVPPTNICISKIHFLLQCEGKGISFFEINKFLRIFFRRFCSKYFFVIQLRGLYPS